jgi:ACS family tartrate transporter-like MFS transporter
MLAKLTPTPDSERGQDARRKAALRILPFLFALYIVSYLDRANVAFAKLPMSADLGFSEAVFGFGAGIFFVGYLLLEIGALIVEHWSARKWIARLLLTWGVCSVLTGFIQTTTQFDWIRFCLGLAEAGFFPGIVIYLSHWFIQTDRARAVSGFTVAVPLSLALGAPVSALILQHGTWLGLSAWRWMFILEGLPAVLLGLVTWFYLTDRPADASWLRPEEKTWLDEKLLCEKEQKRAAGKAKLAHIFREPKVVFLALGLFFVVLGGYGLCFGCLPLSRKRQMPRPSQRRYGPRCLLGPGSASWRWRLVFGSHREQMARCSTDVPGWVFSRWALRGKALR